MAHATLANHLSYLNSLSTTQLLAQAHCFLGPSTIRPAPNKLSISPKSRTSPKLSKTLKSNLPNQPVNCIHTVRTTQLEENHILHHMPSGHLMPMSLAHRQPRSCTMTHANKTKSVQELDQLLDVLIQQLEDKVMISSYRDSQLHLVQGYQPLNHG